MKFREKDFQKLFTAAAKRTGLPTGLYELKLARGNSLPWSSVEGHQITALYKAKHETLVHKISDSALGYKPADTVIYTKSNSYVVVAFFDKKHTPDCCYIIDIDRFIETQKTSRRKSLTGEVARMVGTRFILKADS